MCAPLCPLLLPDLGDGCGVGVAPLSHLCCSDISCLWAELAISEMTCCQQVEISFWIKMCWHHVTPGSGAGCRKTAEIRACQPQEGLCEKRCRPPGATIGRPGPFQTGGRNSDAGSASPAALTGLHLNCPLPAVGEGQGELGLEGSSVKTAMGLREPGRSVGPTVPGDSRRDGSRGEKSLRACQPQPCRYAGSRETSGKQRKTRRRRTEQNAGRYHQPH